MRILTVLIFSSCLLTSLAVAQTPNDPLYGQQSYLQIINIPQAWNFTTGTSSQKMAIIGGGNIRPTHEDLGVRTTIPFNRQRTPFGSQPIHATAAAGVAAATANNAIGIAGINWHAPLLSYDPGTLANIQGHQTPFHIPSLNSISGDVDHAVAEGAQVIIMPFIIFHNNPINLTFPLTPDAYVLNHMAINGEQFSGNLFTTVRKNMTALIDAEKYQKAWINSILSIRSAYLQGRTIVAPTGDFEGVTGGLPAGQAAHRTVISVGATDELGESRASASAHGWLNASSIDTNIDLVAPGVDILTTVNTSDNAYDYVSSTAVSAGLVAGTSSLLHAADPDLQPDDVREILRRTADDIGEPGFDYETGFGRLNAGAAMEYLDARSLVRGVATNGQTTQTRSNTTITVTRGPWGDLAAGTYFGVDEHKVTFTIDVPAGQAPEVWYRANDTRGWSPANPNTQNRFASIEMLDASTAQLTTYVYYIRSNALGQQINSWYPVSPQNARIGYTISMVGAVPPPPLTVSVSNPGFLTEGDYGSWTATATGGPSGDHTFRWYTRTEDFGQPTLVRQHTSSSNTDTYGTIVSESFQLSVTVDRGGQSVSSPWQSVFVEPEDCDPQVDICIGTRPGMLAESVTPDAFSIQPNYPNPFNPTTEIRFSLPESARVTMVVVDLLGREVTRLVDGHMEAGHHRVNVNAETWASGVYLYRIEATGTSGERFIETKRMTLMK